MKLLAVLAVIVGMGASSQGSEDIGVISPEEYRKLHKFSWRIAGGSEASAGQFPYQGFIRNFEAAKDECGAVLIGHQWALTAAVCLEPWTRTDVYFGWSVKTNDSNLVQRTVNRKCVHPKFNPELIHHNIALLQFDDIEFTPLIQPVKIADFSDGNFENWVSVTSGYGRISSVLGGPKSGHLRHVNVTVISNEKCKKIFGEKYIIDKQLCAVGVGDPSKGVCLGDSGGPLVVRGKNGVRLIGLTSFWSNEGCDKKYPSGFVRINHYKKWIITITGPRPA